MNLLKKDCFSTSLADTAVSALLAIGLASTALAAPVMVFQADLNGNRGTANTGPVQSGWTGISGTNTTSPWTNTYSINGVTIALAAGSGNTGWRNDRAQLTVPNVGPLAPLYNSSVFAAGGFDVKMTGLTAGTTYNFILYATDTGNNIGDVRWNYSLAGDKTNPVDAGWVNQPGSTAFTPTANTGITVGTKGIAMLSTTFTATGPAVDFFSLPGTVAVLSGFELYSLPANQPLAANAGADKTVSPGAPSVAIGAIPVASGGTGPYTYSWSPATGLSSTTVSNPAASPTSTTVYTVTVTDSLSATASDSVTVSYPLAANAGADKLCTPSSPSATIGATPTANGGTGPYTYSWSPSTGLDDATVANPTASPTTTTTTYTVTVTDSLSATSSDSVVVTYAVPDPKLISVDFKQGSGTTCAGNTTLTGTTMKNAVGNVFTGQVGNWNALNIGTYNQNSATSGFLNNGAGTATTVKLALGRATGLDNTAAGGWRCSPGEGALGGPDQLRSESAYLYFPTLTVDHCAWALTGLTPNAHYRLTLFGSGTNTFTNIANSVAGVADAEGDWNWTDITADGSGVILGTLLTTGNNQTFGLYGLQLLALGNPPTFAGFAASTPYETSATVSLGKLLANASDPDGDPMSVTTAGPGSAQGGTAVLQAGSILYTPTGGFSGEDTFNITITDAGGASVSGTVTVTVAGNSGVGSNSPVLTTLPGGDMQVDFQGIPGRSYEVQRSTDLTNWTVLATIVAGSTGAVSYTDENPPEGNGFYRLRRP